MWGMWQDHFGDAHDGDIFGPHDAAEAEGFHALAAQAEEFSLGTRRRMAAMSSAP